MLIDAQTFLWLVEKNHSIVFWDIEANGLKGDYHSMLCSSFKPYGRKPYTFKVTKPGDDGQLVWDTKHELEKYNCWVTYYGKGFDVLMLNTRLLCHNLPPVSKEPHIDMYWQLKSHILTARRSQGHLLSWLKLPEQKMSISADKWVQIIANPHVEMDGMIKRCESDVRGLEALYNRTKHLIVDIKR